METTNNTLKFASSKQSGSADATAYSIMSLQMMMTYGMRCLYVGPAAREGSI